MIASAVGTWEKCQAGCIIPTPCELEFSVALSGPYTTILQSFTFWVLILRLTSKTVTIYLIIKQPGLDDWSVQYSDMGNNQDFWYLSCPDCYRLTFAIFGSFPSWNKAGFNLDTIIFPHRCSAYIHVPPPPPHPTVPATIKIPFESHSATSSLIAHLFTVSNRTVFYCS